MSEPDSTPPRRPPTIELKATEVEADKPGAGNDPAAESARTDDASGQQSPKPAAGGPGGARSYIITTFAGTAAGALVVAAIGAGLWFAGYVPARESAPVPNAQAPNSAAIAEISARLKKIEGAIAAQQQAVPSQPPDPALVSRLAAAEAATKSLGDSLGALTRRVDDVAAAAQTALAQAKSASTAADAAKSAAQSGVARSDLDALAARIATLEGAVKRLADDVKHQTASADDRVARLTIAAEALRAAVERGAPYQAELAAVKSLGADQGATAPLEPFAGSGVPGAAAMARELAGLMPALQHAAEPSASNSSFLGRLESNAQRLVRITPVDAPPGDDPASVLARIGVDAAHADTAAALADIAKLPDTAKPPAAAWVGKAQARNAAIAASRKLAADALAALSKPNPQ